jgi:hypothetical protein
MVLRLIPRSPWRPGFLATIASVMRKHHRQLDASVGASGPHGFAVRKMSTFVNALLTSTASRANVRDDHDTPLPMGAGLRDYGSDLGQTRNGIFFAEGLDNDSGDLPVGQIQFDAARQ